jgi:tRNA threonylcarbamoyladenosine biosynthesis protein TsaB
VVAVTSLEALAFSAVRAGADRVVACLDARMGEVYWGCFRADAERGLRPCGVPAVSPPAGVNVPFNGTFHGIGRGFAAYPALKAMTGLMLSGDASTALPDARDVARLGAIRLGAGGGMDAAGLTPVYLRDRVALTEAERAAAKR